MVPALSYEISRVSHYSGYYLVISVFVYWTFTVSGLLSQTILLTFLNQLCSPNPGWISSSGLGSSYFARHYSRNRVFFLFLWVLRCFSSPRSPPIHYFTHVWINQLFSWLEFPHSDIHGLLNICFSPWLFAAYHVFLRLLVPRHPPDALCTWPYNRLKRVTSGLYSLLLLVVNLFLVSLNKYSWWIVYPFYSCHPSMTGLYSIRCLFVFTLGVLFNFQGTFFPFFKGWWTWVDSNHRPHAYQACALTCWATGP